MILFMLPSQQPNKFFKHLHDYIFCLLIHFLHKQNLLLRSINSTVATWQNSRNFEKLERCCQHPSAKEKKEQKRRRSRKLDIFHQFPSVVRWKCCLSLIGSSRGILDVVSGSTKGMDGAKKRACSLYSTLCFCINIQLPVHRRTLEALWGGGKSSCLKLKI